MSLTKATFSMISGAPINVLDYIPQQYHADILAYEVNSVVDVRQYVQAAIDDCPQGHTVYFPAGLYKIVPVDVSGTKIGLKLYASSNHNGIRLLGESDGYFSTTVESTTLWFPDVTAYGIDVVNQSTVIENFSICYAFNGTRPVGGNGSAIRVGNATIKVYGCMVKNCWFTEIPSSAVFVVNGFTYFNTCTVELSRFGVYVDANVYNNRPSAWVWNSQIVGCDIGVVFYGQSGREIYGGQVLNNAFGTNGVNSSYGDVYLTYANTIEINGNFCGQEQGSLVWAENCTNLIIANNNGTLFDKHAIYLKDGQGNTITGNNLQGFDAGNTSTYSGIYLDGTESNYLIDGNTIVGSFTTPSVYGPYGLYINTTAAGTIGTNIFSGKTGTVRYPVTYSNIQKLPYNCSAHTQTANNTPTVIKSMPGSMFILDNDYYVEISANANVAASSSTYAAYKKIYSVRYSSGGVFSINAHQDVAVLESSSAWDIDVVAGSGGSTLDVQVTGAPAAYVYWSVQIQIIGDLA